MEKGDYNRKHYENIQKTDRKVKSINYEAKKIVQ